MSTFLNARAMPPRHGVVYFGVMSTPTCPICGEATRHFADVAESGRTFFICPSCHYIHEPAEAKKISPEEEVKFFKDQWQNSPEGGNPGAFPAIVALLETAGLKPPVKALDFGCGDGWMVRKLRQAGVEATGIDRVYVDNDMAPYVKRELDEVKGEQFDLIISIEVFEHLHDPLSVLTKLVPLLKDDGFIFLTTAVTNRSMPSLRFFPYWVYQQDDTHVGFFHERTFDHLAEKFNLDCQMFGYGQVVLSKSFERVIIQHENRMVFAKEEGGNAPHWPFYKK